MKVVAVGLAAAGAICAWLREHLHSRLHARSKAESGRNSEPQQPQHPAEEVDAVHRALVKRLSAVCQEHILEHWHRLTDAQKDALAKQVESVDFEYVNRVFQASTASSADSAGKAEPPRPADVTELRDISEGEEIRWINLGFSVLAQGKLCILLLAGGQGTRLGSAAPKGCYDIDLPSKKSLFQLQAERIKRLQDLAASATKDQKGLIRKPIRWYIMTSTATDVETKAFFDECDFFGLERAQVRFFQQGELPCLTPGGKVIMQTVDRIAHAPDGNGGVYVALQRSGALADMRGAGCEGCDCVGVDNALVRLGDPLFAGFCTERAAQFGARAVAKAHPEERVGVFARRGGRLAVVEYSELDPAEAAALDKGGRVLRYNWSNVCMQYFSVDFLEEAAERLQAEGSYHVARKSIPSVTGPVSGVKLELFIFDTLPLAERTALLEVRREEEFAPVKNAPGATSDSPATARAALLRLHTGWVKEAGGRVRLAPGEEGLEVSPTVSYQGEGLKALCARKTFRQSYEPALQGQASVLERKLSRRLSWRQHAL